MTKNDEEVGATPPTPLVQSVVIYRAERTRALEADGKVIFSAVKSSDSYLKTIFLFRERAIDRFILPLTIVTINSIVWTALIKTTLEDKIEEYDEEPWGSIYTLVLTTTLAFLLVFRLNRVAVRWWDTRRMWGIIVANARLLACGILEHASHEPQLKDDAIRWLAGFIVSVKYHVSDDGEKPHMQRSSMEQITPNRRRCWCCPLFSCRNRCRRHNQSHVPTKGHKYLNHSELAGFLSIDQVERISSSSHPCLYAASEVRHILKQIFQVTVDTPAGLGASLSSELRMLERSIYTLVDNMGGLERVKSTPLPIAFVTHLRTFIMFYLLSLPYLYGHSWGWGTIPAVFLTSYALLGVDGAASECEAPFGKRENHLNMNAYCMTALQDIEQLIVHYEEMHNR
mmetsp:Transcript_5107/g.7678  ORF Transcript_5107/g.7678 Transcript_5107/m.7678 type:complete len:398 (+) Transcript_5107:27-1220(+)